VYTSTISDEFEPSDIESILACARKNNRGNDVSGALCFSRNHFLQCLEGSRARVNETYRNILNDRRHKNIIILSYEEIVSRVFGQWTMSYIPDTSVTSVLNLRYSGSSGFKPCEMSGDGALQMLIDMGEQVPAVS
jgi:hypothetical protein